MFLILVLWRDFYDVFRLGNSNTSIQLVDIDGVIFSSIQGLGDVYNQLKLRVLNDSKTNSVLVKIQRN